MVDHLEDIISDVFVVHLTTYRVQLLLCVETKNKLSSYPMVDVALFLFYTVIFLILEFFPQFLFLPTIALIQCGKVAATLLISAEESWVINKS